MFRPGRRIARAAVGTAVVAGTAGAVRHQQQKRWDRQEQEQYDQQVQAQQAAAYQQQQAAPAAAPPADDLTTQLEQLAALKDKGILTEEEFQAKKKQLLGI